MKKYTSIEDFELLSQTALESSLAGYWDWNIMTNEEYLSPRFKQMFGYNDDEMENKPESWQRIAFQEDLPKMFESFEAHVKSRGKVPFKSVVRYHHKNGHIVWVRCNGKVVEWSDNNEPLRAIGCHVDITEEKEAEIRLTKAIRERDVLLRELHHRVKNNLQLLLSLSRLKDKDGKIETYEIENSIKSISIAYEAIYHTDDMDHIGIKSYINQIIGAMISGQSIEYSIDSIDYRRGIDFFIPIGLIITELVNNSLKHGRVDSKILKINLIVTAEDETLLIKYCDNGKGYGGKLNTLDDLSSFGLTIIEGLAEQLNGSIKFYDDEGACAELKINLNADTGQY